MKLVILSVGMPRAAWAFEGCSQYEKRVEKLLPLTWETVPEARGIKNVEAVRKKEEERILQRITERDYPVLLDEAGICRSSRDFSIWLYESLQSVPGRLLLVVGGAHGVGERIKSRAAERVSLSPMTFPHELCLVLLFEQLYRAVSIRHGMRYHH
ncbi:23S rRNA (pseudouridine(1915)-N(3))-methyltransferase RlmH [Aminiphilus circumscriptus]|uniref:23S rRNA (pseudouridine(1915)-N(3))-methyltransferase RlmH n=1 Tax=Aminiphilus circumscriptus TaxID=290732 RepID=UPI0004928801